MALLRGLVALCIATALTAAPAAAAPGDLDSRFASGGIFTGSFLTTFPGNEDSQKVAIDSQGRVVVVATLEKPPVGNPPRSINVLRLTPQGAPDTSFGSGGQLTLPFTDVRLGGLVIDAQDRPVIAATSGQLPNGQVALMRLTTGGQPDTTFSGDGQVIAGLPGAAYYGPEPSGLAIDSTGALLVAGKAYAGPPITSAFFITRFSDTGVQDLSYGSAGWRQVGVDAAGTRDLAAIHALPGGGAIVAGYDTDIFVARLTAGGALDNDFDGDGVAHTDLGKGALDGVSDYGLTVDDAGRPVVVGQLTTGGGARWTIARLTSGGAMDGSFGTGTPAPGVVLSPASGARLNDVDVQADGKLVVTGIASRTDLSGNTLAVARYTSGGALDTTFAPGAATPGIATVNAGSSDLGSDLALSPGAITVVGFRRADDNVLGFPIVVRLTAEAGAAPPPVVPPAATPPAPKPPAAAAAVLPKFATLVTLPATRQCVSRRKFSIRLRVPKGSAVTSAEVKVNGKRAAVRRGARLRSVVNLTQLPKGRFRVDIVMKLADGRTVKGTRSYRTCAVKRRGGSGPKV
jgi:uncharacterized delta-60 repeat protein